ncbi:hypothetical protein [Tepidibacter formicigenes]|jgi:hypothetical protein|uniref:Uncharacterized protein n=1 Tax=Tepidibacter formicigenes DSM 15518 TaxID=1123349 RepID=A0A1M6MRE1_9FIRM|nr:hypothetical protein [Tepidibacter formicigenes]SHJ86014.1 hypothetical protein SAMN02744037_01030 [Tepidibacter formicigenes DSM 15518]
MRKIIVISLFLLLILNGCAKPEEKKSESNIPKQPEILTTLQEDIITLMAKIDLMPSINKALEEKKKLDQISYQKEKELSDISNDRLSEKDRKKTEEELEKEKVKISSFIEDTNIYTSLKAEDIKSVNELEKEDLKYKLEDYWMDVKKDLFNIHKGWNELQAKMNTVPIEKDYIDNFENNLNLLTTSISNYDIFNSLVYCNNLTKYISDFKNYFKTPTDNDVDKMKYSVRKAVLLANMNSFDESIKTLTTTSESINAKADMYSKDKEKFLKLKLSIEALKKSIESKDLKLMKIKAPIAIENLNQMMQKKE